VHDLRIGSTRYRLAGSDSEIALSHALGNAFIALQQLEYTIISYLQTLSEGNVDFNASFDLFSSKTFGNLLREMKKHNFLKELADSLGETKRQRDFFVHKFLFNRYGGTHMTTEAEYESLITEAHELGSLFVNVCTDIHNAMLERAPIELFAAKFDPDSGELIIVESEFLRKRRDSGDAQSIK
jgi:hypothetical protein